MDIIDNIFTWENSICYNFGEPLEVTYEQCMLRVNIGPLEYGTMIDSILVCYDSGTMYLSNGDCNSDDYEELGVVTFKIDESSLDYSEEY